MSKPLSIVERARIYIRKIPPAVSGQKGHNQTFHVAGTLVHGFDLHPDVALGLLREWNTCCVPPWNEKELVHKIRSASACTHTKPRGHLLATVDRRPARRCSTPQTQTDGKPRVNPSRAVAEFLRGFRCREEDLAKASPIPLPGDWRAGGGMLIEHLFAEDEMVNLVTNFEAVERRDGRVKARPTGIGVTFVRQTAASYCGSPKARWLEAGAWIRMNPMNGQGVSDKNITAHRFALIESDSLPFELQLAWLARLPLPIAALITSGGDSIHAWVRLDAADASAYQRDTDALYSCLARLGIDRQNSNPSRLSRLPGVTRVLGAKNDGRQRLLYLNPRPEQRRIIP